MTLAAVDIRVSLPIHGAYPEYDEDFVALSRSDIQRLIRILSRPPNIRVFRQMHQTASINIPFIRLMSYLYIRAHSVDGFPTLYEAGSGYGADAIYQMYEASQIRLKIHR